MHAMFVENIIMFIPFGVLLPILFRKFRSGWAYILTGFICSCSIEILQHITQTGYLQLDDVVTNRTGTAVGMAGLESEQKNMNTMGLNCQCIKVCPIKAARAQ